jgi:hypothetical protein
LIICRDLRRSDTCTGDVDTPDCRTPDPAPSPGTRAPVRLLVQLGRLLGVLLALTAKEARGERPADPACRPCEALPALRLCKVCQEQPLLQTPNADTPAAPDCYEVEETVSPHLRPGDLTLVEAGQAIPADGTIVAGAASIDEAAQTGESAPVLREAEGSDPAVRAGTRVLSGCIVVSVAGEPAPR